ncbi:GAF domain-containing protein [Saccharicrinis fermentans]|uniref:Free methionine-R-sulfoxide reductase n=1 Tax=Saccharicrinis fermentans DSM 9555 = JCM 21142 TaxID=869213 RepID=W7XTY0_9BACT|nr:GAF domain-containing protein [Saccharicrinis fermentans]GAF01465.1 free methionine-R-sulfoxide reductase [Saccharicrinis fermentans DSM 9555 = JCM 21142]
MTKESSKLAKYKRLYAQVEELTAPVDNPLSRMSTMVALLHHKMKGFFWTGFYLLQDGELLVGPYQGPVACLRLRKDVGVCWAGINTQKTILVDDVECFPGHIACSSLTKSEIVVPLMKEGRVVGVLDIDSRDLAQFDQDDQAGLELLLELIYK